MRFSQNLTRLMLAKGINQDQLAAALKKSQATVSRWENGTVPHKRTLEKIAAYFNLGVEELLTGADPNARIDGAKALAAQHPGTRLEKQMKFDRVAATLISEPARWMERALAAEEELSALKRDLGKLMARAGIEPPTAKNLPSDIAGNKKAAVKEKRRHRPLGSLTDVAAVSVGLFECPAGGPLLPANRIGKVKVNPGRWDAADLFALRLNGDSMDRAGLHSGDVVLCVWAERREPESGDVVVVHLHGDGCTLKRLHGPEGKRWLEPESTNPAHERIALDGEGEPQAVIQAVMLGKV